MSPAPNATPESEEEPTPQSSPGTTCSLWRNAAKGATVPPAPYRLVHASRFSAS